MFSTVTRYHSRLLPGTIRDKCNSCHSHALQTGTHSYGFLPCPQWKIRRCVSTWVCAWMRRWPSPQTVPSHLDVFGRLSGEVHTIFVLSINAKSIYRVLLSTIKSNMDHLCPRCLVKKIDTIKMGTHLDMRNRCAGEHINDHRRQTTVWHARQIVFKQGVPLSSDQLKVILGSFSGVPTQVSHDT